MRKRIGIVLAIIAALLMIACGGGIGNRLRGKHCPTPGKETYHDATSYTCVKGPNGNTWQ